MKEIGQYDTSLQMFVEKPRPLSEEKLRFLRWLAVRGGLEHPVAGPPAGDVALAIVMRTNQPIDAVLAPKSIKEAQDERKRANGF